MEPLKVGIAGLRRGRTFVTQFAALPETRVAALCDLDPGLLENTLAGLGADSGARGFADYAEMLRADLDIIVVATPAPDHARHCCAALEAGKHVLSEVPADISMDGCRQLVRTVRATGRKYMLAENCCYWGFVREYRRQVQAGRIGEVLYAEGEYLHDIRDLYLKNPVLPAGTPFEELLRHPQTRRTCVPACIPSST